MAPVPLPCHRKVRLALGVEEGELDGGSGVALAFLQLEVEVRRGAEPGAARRAQRLPRRHSIARFDERRPREDVDVLGQEAVFLQNGHLISRQSA